MPKATRLLARLHISSSARSAGPMRRMQWWMRPGAQAALGDLEATAFAQQDVGDGRTFSNVISTWPWGRRRSRTR